MSVAPKTYQTVLVEKDSGITWVTLNRPEKRNAMNPTMHFEMVEVLTELEEDPETAVMVLTGAGESWCAGQDLKEFFRELDDKPAVRRRLEQAGVSVSPGRSLDFLDPWGNQIQVVDYRDIQFTKAPHVLKGMGLTALGKSESALAELREKGLAP